MLLFAMIETWAVTIWQLYSFRSTPMAWFFSFPYTVVHQVFWWGYGYQLNAILIGFGVPIPNLHYTLFILELPGVSVFWETQTRLLAFRIIFSFHLVALWLFLLILAGVDIIQRRLHVRGVSKHPKGALGGFSRSSEDERRRLQEESKRLRHSRHRC